MIDLISHSKVRQNIILLFIYNRQKDFYANEIARLLGMSPGTVHRELQRLMKQDFLTTSRKGNLVLYSVNEDNPLLEEIEGIIRKTIGIEVLLREAFVTTAGIEFAFIFGSYAKKQFRSQSDIDLYLIGTAEEADFQADLDRVEKTVRRDINYHLSDRQEFKEKAQKSHFHKEILENMILVKGNEEEFRKFIG